MPGVFSPVANATTAQIQASIDAAVASGGPADVVLSGATTLTSTLTVAADNINLTGSCKLTAGFTGGPMVRFQNAAYCRTGPGLFFDGNWQSGVPAIELRGAILGDFDVIGDRLMIGVNLDCANAAATQNSALNVFRVTVRNGVQGMIFKGKSGQYASNNVIEKFYWWGAASVPTSTGLDFAAYCDNNYTLRAYISLGATGHTGVILNSQSPTSDLQVYENHFAGIIETQVTGTVAVDGNRTWDSASTTNRWPTYMSVRLSGSQTPSVDLQDDSDVVFCHSNFNGQIIGSMFLPHSFIWPRWT